MVSAVAKARAEGWVVDEEQSQWGGVVCLEEMVPGLRPGPLREAVECEATARGQVPPVTVSALIVVKRYLTSREHPVMQLAAPGAVPG